MSKFVKITLSIVLSIIIVVALLFFTFLIVTKDAVLDESKLLSTSQNITIFDDDGNEITNASASDKNKRVELKTLDKNTINAFIASEDRTFYKHGGLNYKRMIKALITNISSKSFKQGASTISQQLIKNTHLSSDKTISRKLNEIRLTKKLEKRYSKDEILEMYLNTIYFGHNCYGLESAAEFYFDKKAKNLSLAESATLVGLLTSPNNYSPYKYPEKSLKKRNLVLKSMLECGYIDESTYNETKILPIETAKKVENGKNSDYIGAVFGELEDIGISAYTVTGRCKIYTYLDADLQKTIENMDFETDNAVIVTTTDGKVNAYKTTVGDTRRQPASTVKPLFVYAPAIQEKIISPFTKILDEKINFGGYSPENYDKKYRGYVTACDSLCQSLNVPAVKTFNSLTVEKAEKYINGLGITLEKEDKNLSLALGGMKYGLTLKELADAYSVFAESGNFVRSHFIKKIVAENGNAIYEDKNNPTKVFDGGTCSLMNDMLLKTSKSGTTKKLRDFEFDIASKSGTCGNSDGNTDAYAVGYTSEHCIGVWLGDKNNRRTEITGGGTSCNYLKAILEQLYRDHSPKNLDTMSGTESIEIDAEEYNDNNKVVLCDPLSPELNKLSVKVLCDNVPTDASTKFSSPSIKIPSVSVQNGQVCIRLCQTKYYAYLVKRTKNGKTDTIYDGCWQEQITDEPENGYYTYSVTPYYVSDIGTMYGKEITLPAVNLQAEKDNPQIKIPGIANKDWYNQ